ncbi:hypothetical protein K438DRAFT_1993646 [Mycena galopus ATCC 62051]|nr:hypothetical protein K438DRAFT_1993646 [Mycena galopus ATCC 62051]
MATVILYHLDQVFIMKALIELKDFSALYEITVRGADALLLDDDIVDLENIFDILLSVGPSAITRLGVPRPRSHRERHCVPLSELDGGEQVSLDKTYNDLPLGSIWAARRVTPPNEGERPRGEDEVDFRWG